MRRAFYIGIVMASIVSMLPGCGSMKGTINPLPVCSASQFGECQCPQPTSASNACPIGVRLSEITIASSGASATCKINIPDIVHLGPGGQSHSLVWMLDQGTGLLPAAALVRFDVNTGIEFKSSSAASQMFPETVKGNPGDFAPPQPTGKEGRPVKTTLEATEFTSSFPMMPTPAVTTTYYYNVKIDFAPSPGASFQSCLVLDPRIMNP